MYSAIAHGVINLIGEVPVFVSVSKVTGLLGPQVASIHQFLASQLAYYKAYITDYEEEKKMDWDKINHIFRECICEK